MIPLLLLVVAQAAPSYRLRADVLAASQAPSGVIALSGEAKQASWVSAEALLWAGDEEIDALIASVRLVHPDGLGELRAGRMLLATGALRPVHFDGAAGLVRAPWGTTVEAFAGSPVVPRFAYRGGDWLVGGRVVQRVSDLGHVGVAVLRRTDDGALADQEVGLDAVFVPVENVDVAARAAYDLVTYGVSEASLGGGVTLSPVRVSVLAQHRSPSRILLATSVFSVLGDVPSNAFLVTADWRAAPRLDVSLTAGARHVDGWGDEIRLASTLRLDDRGHGAVGVVLTRYGAGGAGWMGARVFVRQPIVDALIASLEAELARTEDGDVWPWALGAITWRFLPRWDAALAVESSASPTYRYAVQAIGRVGYRWSGP
ncbi:MAG: hypothetical protein RIT81_00040 [Deltaproteobacteria bacterium]